MGEKKSTKDANILILIDVALIQDPTPVKIERKPYGRSTNLLLIYIVIAISFSPLPLLNTDLENKDPHQADLKQIDLHRDSSATLGSPPNPTQRYTRED